MSQSSFPAVITAIDALARKRQGIGRTHIHKFLYLAQTWGVVRSSHKFSLYLHGPYSRDLDGELLALRAAGFITATPEPSGFGARYSANQKYVAAAKRSLVTDSETLRKLDTLAEHLAPMGVRTLEAVSTAEYVRQSSPGLSVPDQGAAVRELKPHLSKEEVETAIANLLTLREQIEGDRPS